MLAHAARVGAASLRRTAPMQRRAALQQQTRAYTAPMSEMRFLLNDVWDLNKHYDSIPETGGLNGESTLSTADYAYPLFLFCFLFPSFPPLALSCFCSSFPVFPFLLRARARTCVFARVPSPPLSLSLSLSLFVSLYPLFSFLHPSFSPERETKRHISYANPHYPPYTITIALFSGCRHDGYGAHRDG